MEDTMAKIENTSNGPRGLYSIEKKDADGNFVVAPTFYLVPGATVSQDGKETKINGVLEIPDDVINALRAADLFTKGLFDSCELVASAADAKKDAKKDPPPAK